MLEDPEFKITHEFHLLDGSVVCVMAELRGGWIARELDGTLWYTVMGDTHPEWTCSARGVSGVCKVIKYGHRYCIQTNGKSFRYMCECLQHSSWLRSIGGAVDKGGRHHHGAVLVNPASVRPALRATSSASQDPYDPDDTNATADEADEATPATPDDPGPVAPTVLPHPPLDDVEIQVIA